MSYLWLFIACFFVSGAVVAEQDSNHLLSPDDWKQVMEKVALLDDSGLMPSLLPVIMRNRDALQLNDEQLSAFRAWRKKNYTNMVDVMNEIIEKKVKFRIESLSKQVSGDHLIAFQSQIHELQRQLLQLKLSCRELVMTSFTDEQWDNFAFVVSDHPRLASLVMQANNLNPEHRH